MAVGRIQFFTLSAAKHERWILSEQVRAKEGEHERS